MPARKIFSERLKELEQVLGLTPTEMANIGDCSQSTYYRYRKGESIPDLEFLNNILKNKNKINAEWLLKGIYPILKKDTLKNSDKTRNPIKFLNLPYYTMNPIQEGGEGQLSVEEWKNPSRTIPFCNTFINTIVEPDTNNLLAVNVKCDSMSPVIKPGSIILVNRDQTDPAGDGIFIVQLDDEIRMKLVQRLPSKRLQLSTINNKFNPIEVGLDEDNFDIIGRIIWRGAAV
ncbi:XRE family transcriptional regulator [Fodinibius sediminis]|uniref:Peptidase S24-like n=1 Tax=Fodinibius sediminis TaxID=1214077 RepID=A0A521EXD5_9BACT|nr:LexA family transcriptional regulator [Fodinibius sediminis]SMO88632.1 Peptidase S24-like [Fodinibius sediminis]